MRTTGIFNFRPKTSAISSGLFTPRPQPPEPVHRNRHHRLGTKRDDFVSQPRGQQPADVEQKRFGRKPLCLEHHVAQGPLVSAQGIDPIKFQRKILACRTADAEGRTSSGRSSPQRRQQFPSSGAIRWRQGRQIMISPAAGRSSSQCRQRGGRAGADRGVRGRIGDLPARMPQASNDRSDSEGDLP